MWIADATTMLEINPVVIVAEAKSQAQAHNNVQHTIGVCITADNIGNAITDISPNWDAGYVSTLYGQNFSGAGAKVEVIQQPQKGTLQPSPSNSEQRTNYQYTPNPALAEARDRDYFVISVKNQGVTITLRYYVEISILEPNEPRDEGQCAKRSWKISIAPNSSPTDLAYFLSLPKAFTGPDG